MVCCLPMACEFAEGRPISFEADRGQFFARAGGYTVSLTSESITFESSRTKPVTITFSGARRQAAASSEAAGWISNYFIGNDPSQWRTRIPHYSRVRYERAYPGVDLDYYVKEGNIEFDLTVGLDADPKQIAMEINGAGGTRVDENGDLVLEAERGLKPATTFEGGRLVLHKPVVYQKTDEGSSLIGSRYVLSGGTVRIALEKYDRRLPLV
ncbi:MAG TPA: hypothetical protein VE422_16695 [Terriglobia bacterium]|nr:hypothetical protein [Terriglobia bacterium]